MSGLWHKIEHLFEWNTGHVVSAIDEAGWIWIAFQCDQCGKVSGRHPKSNTGQGDGNENYRVKHRAGRWK